MIKTIADVRNFFEHLTQERKVSFHPDDDFESYINIDTNEPTFTAEECKRYNEAMQQCFDVCQAEGEDIYLIGMDALFAANGVSHSPIDPIGKV